MDVKEISKPIEDVGKSAREYVNVKIDQAKLRLAKELSQICNILFAWMIIILAIALTTGFLCAALGQWVGQMVGSVSLGYLISGGVLLIVTLLLIICKRHLFINGLVRTFVKIFFDDESDK